jgi:hypothetical protein
VKANVFFTPAPNRAEPSPLKTLQKAGSPRLRRGKVKVYQVDTNADTEEEDVDYERMPPTGERG